MSMAAVRAGWFVAPTQNARWKSSTASVIGFSR